MSAPETRIVVAIPSHDGTMALGTSSTLLRWRQWAAQAPSTSLEVVTYRGPHICQGRDSLVRMALEQDATHVLFLDADVTVVEPDAVGQLVYVMERERADVVGGLYVNKPAEGDGSYGVANAESVYSSAICHSPADTEPAELRWTNIHPPLPDRPFGPPEGSALWLATGLMLVRAQVFTATLRAPWFEFVELDGPCWNQHPTQPEKLPPRRWLIPEDWWFCEKVRRAGGTVVCDPRLTTLHAGPCQWSHTPPRSESLQVPMGRASIEIASALHAGQRAAALAALDRLRASIVSAEPWKET